MRQQHYREKPWQDRRGQPMHLLNGRQRSRAWLRSASISWFGLCRRSARQSDAPHPASGVLATIQPQRAWPRPWSTSRVAGLSPRCWL